MHIAVVTELLIQLNTFCSAWLPTWIISMIWVNTQLHKHLCWRKSKSYSEAGVLLLSLVLQVKSINWPWNDGVSVQVVSENRVQAERAFSLFPFKPHPLFTSSFYNKGGRHFLHKFPPAQVRQGSEWGMFLWGAKQSETVTRGRGFSQALPLKPCLASQRLICKTSNIIFTKCTGCNVSV